jgi:hypothetical protein
MAAIPSANGRAFQAYLEGALAALGGRRAVDYYQEPLPAPVDEQLARVVGAYTALPARQRERFAAALSPAQRALFGIFGHRAATLSVRRTDPEWLRLGLAGSAIANFDIPPRRDVDVSLAVFYHCARALELEPVRVFDEAAEFATEEMAARLRAFGRREGFTLKQFGWRELHTPEGVRYKFEWR